MNKKLGLTQAVTAAMAAGAGMNFSAPPSAPYDNNPDRSRGAREFKRKKKRRKAAKKSRRTNRR